MTMTPEEVAKTIEVNEALIRAYRLSFGSPAGQEVLLDLMGFCRFRAPLNEPVLLDEGKRQVFVRIMNFLSFTPEQLQQFYSGRPVIRGEIDA